MLKLTPYSLTFMGGLHVGQGVENLAESRVSIPADTLFAALLDAWQYLEGNVEEFTRPFFTQPPDPPFLLTSAFPFADGVRFYPLPVDLGRIFSEKILNDFDRNKPLKRLRFFSESLFILASNVQCLDDWLFPKEEHLEPKKGVALQGGAFWLTVDEIEKLPRNFRRPLGKRHSLPQLKVWSNQTVPRVTVDRISSSGNIFQADRVVFSNECGLWFGIEWLKDDMRIGKLLYKDALAKIIEFLSTNGLGGERSAGYGGFEYRSDASFDLNNATTDSASYLLSRYHPQENELSTVLVHDNTAYRLEAIAGWLGTPSGAAQRRKRLWLVAEGSLVHGIPVGDIVNVRPTHKNPEGDIPHPVYRSGLAVAVGWHNTVQEEVRHG